MLVRSLLHKIEWFGFEALLKRRGSTRTQLGFLSTLTSWLGLYSALLKSKLPRVIISSSTPLGLRDLRKDKTSSFFARMSVSFLPATPCLAKAAPPTYLTYSNRFFSKEVKNVSRRKSLAPCSPFSPVVAFSRSKRKKGTDGRASFANLGLFLCFICSKLKIA